MEIETSHTNILPGTVQYKNNLYVLPAVLKHNDKLWIPKITGGEYRVLSISSQDLHPLNYNEARMSLFGPIIIKGKEIINYECSENIWLLQLGNPAYFVLKASEVALLPKISENDISIGEDNVKDPPFYHSTILNQSLQEFMLKHSTTLIYNESQCITFQTQQFLQREILLSVLGWLKPIDVYNLILVSKSFKSIIAPLFNANRRRDLKFRIATSMLFECLYDGYYHLALKYAHSSKTSKDICPRYIFGNPYSTRDISALIELLKSKRFIDRDMSLDFFSAQTIIHLFLKDFIHFDKIPLLLRTNASQTLPLTKMIVNHFINHPHKKGLTMFLNGLSECWTSITEDTYKSSYLNDYIMCFNELIFLGLDLEIAYKCIELINKVYNNRLFRWTDELISFCSIQMTLPFDLNPLFIIENMKRITENPNLKTADLRLMFPFQNFTVPSIVYLIVKQPFVTENIAQKISQNFSADKVTVGFLLKWNS